VQALGQTGAFPYITVLCKFADATNVEPHPAGTYSLWMTSTSAPYLDHYWREQSYGQMNKGGSQVAGWFTLPRARSFYVPGADANLEALANDCLNAADAAISFPSYHGINLQFNQRLDCCSWGGTRTLTRDGQTKHYAFTWMADWADLATYAHEEGHSLGLSHSSGPYIPENDSRWDVMSNPNVFGDVTVGSYIPQHTISWHKDLLGWVAASRKLTPALGTTRTITLERVAQPGAGNYLLAQIPIDNSSFYTVEARQFVGSYDSHVPGEAVVVHRVEGMARVVDVDQDGNPNDDAAMWTPGETFTDATAKVSVRVGARTTSGFQVTLAYGTVLPNHPPNATINSPVDNVTIQPGQSVSFAGAGADPDGPIVAYSWSFPGGNPSSSGGQSPGLVTYSTAGTYTASFNVTDYQGATDPTPATRTITVQASTAVLVSVSDVAFTPEVAASAQGRRVQWNFKGPGSHNATDRSGMGLFGSGNKAPGTSYSFTFLGAGTYKYKCTLHPTTHSGSVKVPLQITPAAGGVTTRFTVTWASAAAPSGYVYDVQVKRPGATSFVNWKVGQTARSGSFVPDAGAGRYTFRARLRKPAVAKASVYSTGKSIGVS
jgi:M6 family metalloprotease-like protein